MTTWLLASSPRWPRWPFWVTTCTNWLIVLKSSRSQAPKLMLHTFLRANQWLIFKHHVPRFHSLSSRSTLVRVSEVLFHLLRTIWLYLSGPETTIAPVWVDQEPPVSNVILLTPFIVPLKSYSTGVQVEVPLDHEVCTQRGHPFLSSFLGIIRALT